MFPFRKAITCFVLLVCSFLSTSESLFDEKEFKALHADKKAFKVGDGVTIMIYQTVQAKSSAGEGSSGDIGFSGSFGVDERRYGSDLSLGSSRNGDAETNRNGFVRAQLTAVIVRETEHGALVIRGTQTITVNEEQQTISVQGTVRPEDISSQNTVASFRIQDAEISIEGEGEVSSGKNGNVFTRLMEWMGL